MLICMRIVLLFDNLFGKSSQGEQGDGSFPENKYGKRY
jgi:hypothetical protein